MQTHVYANGLEIACKAAGDDGVSPQAFPDPCWSPPAPSAGPIVVPYPNTAFARDITNGTATVFIHGKEVAIEDHSYFATSTGNESATQSFNKGVATGVITGKAYFTQWSPNVFFEGFGVPRHTDLVGHNQGSAPSNTALFPYLSRSWFGGNDCSKEQKRIERACKPEKDDPKKAEEFKKQSKFRRLLAGHRTRSGVGRRDKNDWHWTDDHCDGLQISLDAPEKALEYAKKMEDVFKKFPSEVDVLNTLEAKLKDMAVNAASKAAGKWAAKTGIKEAAGTELPIVGNIAMGIWSLYDAASSVGSVEEIKANATEALDNLETFKSKLGEITDLSKEFENFSKLSPEAQLKKAQELAVDGQELLATANSCTRARKCNLVPYKADGLGNTFGKRDARNPSKVESASNGGCCSGQTGHHLIPEGSVKDVCPGYDHNAAPTVCVEGTSQNFGSHKRAHAALAKMHQKLDERGKIAPDGTMSMDDALNAATDSHAEAFPASSCSKKCIRAQLESYYKACRNARPYMVNEYSQKSLPGSGRGKAR